MRQFPGHAQVIDLVDMGVCADICDELGGPDVLGIGNLFNPQNIRLVAVQHTLNSLSAHIQSLVVQTCGRKHHEDNTSQFDCPLKATNLVCGHNYQIRDIRGVRHCPNVNAGPYSPTAFGHMAVAVSTVHSAGIREQHWIRRMNQLAQQLRQSDGGAEVAYRLVKDGKFDEAHSIIPRSMMRPDWNAAPSVQVLRDAVQDFESEIGKEILVLHAEIHAALKGIIEPELVQLSYHFGQSAEKPLAC